MFIIIPRQNTIEIFVIKMFPSITDKYTRDVEPNNNWKIVGYHIVFIIHNEREIEWMHDLKYLISACFGFIVLIGF